jgi:hypothetical protein
MTMRLKIKSIDVFFGSLAFLVYSIAVYFLYLRGSLIDRLAATSPNESRGPQIYYFNRQTSRYLSSYFGPIGWVTHAIDTNGNRVCRPVYSHDASSQQ